MYELTDGDCDAIRIDGYRLNFTTPEHKRFGSSLAQIEAKFNPNCIRRIWQLPDAVVLEPRLWCWLTGCQRL